MISAVYIQKTVKADLHVKSNNTILPQNLRGKVLKDSRRLSTKTTPEGVTCGAGRPVGPFISLPIAMAVSYRFLGYIYAVS
jgi:hypothetical protein